MPLKEGVLGTNMGIPITFFINKVNIIESNLLKK